MALVSIASANEGCGKTSLAILVGAELALDSYKVALLDCDLNQHAAAFGFKAKLPGFSVVSGVSEETILKALRTAEKEADVVLVDLPGGSSNVALKALQRSDLVLVPLQSSLRDARDAIKTLAQVDDAEELARTPIARALVWTRIASGFESLAGRHVRESIEAENVPILSTALQERAAFRAIHLTGSVPRQSEPNGKAAQNVTALTKDILTHLKTGQVAA